MMYVWKETIPKVKFRGVTGLLLGSVHKAGASLKTLR